MEPIERKHCPDTANTRRIEFWTYGAYKPFEIIEVKKKFKRQKCTVCPECLSRKWCGQNLRNSNE